LKLAGDCDQSCLKIDALIGDRTARIEGGAVQRLEFFLQPASADT
jgi:hypothetical protein